MEIIAPNTIFDSRKKYGYSQAVRVGNTIYIAGQTACDEKENLVGPGDFVAQTRQTYENIRRALEACGAKMTDIVKMNFYVKDIREVPKAAGVFKEYFGHHYPACTCIQISSLWDPAYLLEVEAIAVVEK